MLLAKWWGVPPPRIYTRLGREKTAQFPDLAAPLAAFGARLRRPVLLDGEIVATDNQGAALPFQHLQERLHATGGAIRAAARHVTAMLVVFDLLRHGDEDLRPLPLTERRQRLEQVMRRNDAPAVVRQANWRRTAGGSPAERRSNQPLSPRVMRRSL